MKLLVALWVLVWPYHAAHATEPTVRSSFLRVEPEIFGLYGVELRKDDRDVGPGFLTLGLGAAVRGSADAERHARHAKIWAILNLAFGVAGMGLLVADLATYGGNHGDNLGGWPDFVPRSGQDNQNAYLGLGWFLSVGFATASRYMTYEEILLSVSDYNYDLVR